LFLPDQDHFLYFARDTAGSGEHLGVNGTYIGSLSSTESKLISHEIANNTQFALGRLYFVRDRSLMAQAFDVKKFQLMGTPEVILPQELDQIPRFRAGYSSLIMVQWSSSQPRITFLT
jgi:hypothetical protein